MVLLISLLLVAQSDVNTGKPLWASPDGLIEDALGSYVAFAADYNYSNGDIYVACAVDSGAYFGPDSIGILLFRSTDHGESGGEILRDVYPAEGWKLEDIDLVATRSDTVYILLSWYNKGGGGFDQMNIAKVYDTGGSWTLEWMLDDITATEIRSPKLVRDDFDDFYLYMSYLDVTADRDTIHVLRSADRGYNWSIMVKAGSASDLQDEDIAVADSSLYYLLEMQTPGWQTLQLTYWRGRGNPATATTKNLLQLNMLSAEPIHYPRIGATTTLPDTGQLVYAFYSQEDSISGDYSLLYLYSENGGDDWTTTPNILLSGSFSPVLCDLRGYEVEPNEYMDITFCVTSSVPYFENEWCWTSESNPTNWQGITSVATGANRSMPELFYSPGALEDGAGVVYNDSLGNLWIDAPWLLSGVEEDLIENEDKTRSQIVLIGSTVEVGPAGAVVYDVTGREIRKLNTDLWDLKDEEGNEVKGGIYFIVDENGSRLKLSVMK